MFSISFLYSYSIDVEINNNLLVHTFQVFRPSGFSLLRWFSDESKLPDSFSRNGANALFVMPACIGGGTGGGGGGTGVGTVLPLT